MNFLEAIYSRHSVRPSIDSIKEVINNFDPDADPAEWEAKAKDLSGRFIKNFVKYEGNEAGKALVAAGPQL